MLRCDDGLSCRNLEVLSIIMRNRRADTFQLTGLINSFKKVLNH